MKFIVFIISILSLNISFAQIDTNHIQVLPDTKVVGLHTNLRLFQLSFNSEETEPIYFQNYNLAIGIRLKYKKIGLSFSVPIRSFQGDNLGESKAYGLGFGIYPNSFFVQGDMRYIKGLSNLNQARFRADMKAIYANLHTVYLFNSERFSLRSAFKMVNRQKRSAGSFLATATLEYQQLVTDSIRLQLSEQDFLLKRYNAYKFGLGGGYAHTFVFGKWSITGLLSGGAEFRRLNYATANSSSFRDFFRVSPRLRMFASCIYNDEHLFYGFTSSYLPGLDISDVLNTRIVNWSIRLSVGWRFY